MRRNTRVYPLGIILALAIAIMVIFQGRKRNNPRIVIVTELGKIELELYPEKAPLSCANFLRYVKENRYSEGEFYRVVTLHNQTDDSIRIEVIQGGLGFEAGNQELPPIPHETTQETGIRHKNGTLSMARNQPGTASSEFFICIGDQPELDFGGMRNQDEQGFAAFGKVIKGMHVVRKIQSQPEEGQLLVHPIKFEKVFRIQQE